MALAGLYIAHDRNPDLDRAFDALDSLGDRELVALAIELRRQHDADQSDVPDDLSGAEDNGVIGSDADMARAALHEAIGELAAALSERWQGGSIFAWSASQCSWSTPRAPPAWRLDSFAELRRAWR